MISYNAQEILKKMVAADADEDYEDAELVCEGRECWLGHWRIRRAAVNELLLNCLISDRGEEKGIERFAINEDGRKAAIDRSYVNQALAARRAVKQ